MTQVSSEITWEGHETIHTWKLTDTPWQYQPASQIYGICYNDSGKVLLIKDENWQIPGGKPEKDETPEETLRRELREEAQVEITDIRPLGVQEVSFPNNPNKEEGDLYYQHRYIARITKINPSQPDPDTGKTWERTFVSFEEANELMGWGDLGAEMFKDVKEKWKSSFNS